MYEVNDNLCLYHGRIVNANTEQTDLFAEIAQPELQWQPDCQYNLETTAAYY